MDDYKELYLKQKVHAMRMELELLQKRFAQVQEELPETIAELEEYQKNLDKKKEKQE